MDTSKLGTLETRNTTKLEHHKTKNTSKLGTPHNPREPKRNNTDTLLRAISFNLFSFSII